MCLSVGGCRLWVCVQTTCVSVRACVDRFRPPVCMSVGGCRLCVCACVCVQASTGLARYAPVLHVLVGVVVSDG